MRGAAVLVLAWMLAACSPTVAPSEQTAAGLTVFAAASLTHALEVIGAEWSREDVEVGPLTYATGSSAALRTQIHQGARADVFLSADLANPQILGEAGLVDGDVVTFARNRLVIVVPPDNPAAITSPADMARAGACVIAAGENVPITTYASQLVDTLARLPGYGPDFAKRYDANICSREDDVRAVLTKVELGEGDAAIVYATDARAADVLTIDLPPDVEVTADYGAVALSDGPNREGARTFLAWLTGARGRQILADFGFAPPP